jgi:branched-chain amino acid transport system ATP-binding protein
VKALEAGYNQMTALHGIDLVVHAGEAVGIIGHNGAGKTTTLKTIFGNIKASGGSITFAGQTQSTSDCRDSIRRGMAFVPSDGYIFASLTVRENLQIARLQASSTAAADEAEELAMAMFPVVGERLGQVSSTLSGGERRMLGIAMSLMWNPRLLILDEPSLGLAPALAGRVFATVRQLVAERAIGVLCVEQNVTQLLGLVSRIYILRSGRIVDEKSATELGQESDLWRYF